ncbi:uncharacterized protein LOC115886160 [Sitophilus oryzae]|uniref:Uncharacterized protein LOC115886160 n=1 Tax=Sitophilus oryzae TaxID=7048 RepID=A0A6J2YCB4_SITOR|nr:uncharacterized protein LOC115886160 [Sitophilus oryzae]
MSKSSSLNRSSSMETDQETGDIASPKEGCVPPTLEEGNENALNGNDHDTDNDQTNTDSLNNTEATDESNIKDGIKDLVPASPPPSYEFVLEEKRLKQQQSTQSPTTPPKAQEIMHKSSKEFYKAVAKQFGITCKMSDHCRCYDCQSHYFDCEYEQNEQEKTDGGLGAGTPVFLQEVMHGTACNIL